MGSAPRGLRVIGEMLTCTIEIGLSDFHKVTVTVLNSTFKKAPLKLLQYRNYDKFCNEEFVSLLLNKNALESFIYVTAK